MLAPPITDLSGTHVSCYVEVLYGCRVPLHIRLSLRIIVMLHLILPLSCTCLWSVFQLFVLPTPVDLGVVWVPPADLCLGDPHKVMLPTIVVWGLRLRQSWGAEVGGLGRSWVGGCWEVMPFRGPVHLRCIAELHRLPQACGSGPDMFRLTRFILWLHYAARHTARL